MLVVEDGGLLIDAMVHQSLEVHFVFHFMVDEKLLKLHVCSHM
jgi:hypothetical protein